MIISTDDYISLDVNFAHCLVVGLELHLVGCSSVVIHRYFTTFCRHWHYATAPVADLEGGRAGSGPPLGDELTPSLTVTLAYAKF